VSQIVSQVRKVAPPNSSAQRIDDSYLDSIEGAAELVRLVEARQILRTSSYLYVKAIRRLTLSNLRSIRVRRLLMFLDSSSLGSC
jgi:hypothetical protein